MRRQAEVLGSRHDVTLLEAASLDLGPGTSKLSFASEDHRRSVAVLEAIQCTYAPGEGPDYIEFCDYRAPGLVTLQARAAGHELLRATTIGLRLSGTAELIALHDGRSRDPGERLVADLEREQLRLADRLLSPAAGILDLYRRYYPELPAATLVGRPYPPRPLSQPVPRRDPLEPLRILSVGRLQRLKGTLDLVEACLRLGRDNWELTLIGVDTATAHMGQSVRMTAEAMCAGDPRVKFEDPLPHEALQCRYPEFDLLVQASTFEVCSNVVLEAMCAGIPALVTPVGGQLDVVEHGVSGWSAATTGPAALRAALSHLLEDPAVLEQVRRSGEPAARARRFTDPGPYLSAMESVLAGPGPAGSRRGPLPVSGSWNGTSSARVTAVVPYYRTHAYVQEAIASLLAQSHQSLDVIVVNDGSFGSEDDVLDRLGAEPRVRVVHRLRDGEAHARNLGLSLAEGEYLLMFDADNLLKPEFVTRALALLATQSDLAYVTCWMRFIGPDGAELEGRGYAPLGNAVRTADDENWDGDTTAVFPRAVLERLRPRFDPRVTFHGDWNMYRRLRARGEFGAVIPEPLVLYRIHSNSLLRTHDESLHRRSWKEAENWRRLTETNGNGMDLMGEQDPGGNEVGRDDGIEELLRVNSELAAEIRRLNGDREAHLRPAQGPAAGDLARLVSERDYLAVELAQTEAELGAVRADRDGLERQNQRMGAEIVRLRTGIGGLLRRARGRVLAPQRRKPSPPPEP